VISAIKKMLFRLLIVCLVLVASAFQAPLVRASTAQVTMSAGPEALRNYKVGDRAPDGAVSSGTTKKVSQSTRARSGSLSMSVLCLAVSTVGRPSETECLDCVSPPEYWTACTF